ncbi:MAG: hypothetical protein K2K28_03185, partial [Clostridia bacterium]|nr:hypothetical protein [Clostridia bacterium]
KYKIKFNLKQTAKDVGIKWTDGSAGEKTITFEIKRLGINVPKVSVVSKEYNASGNTFALNADYDPAIMSASAETSGMTWNSADTQFEATAVGSYTVKFSLTDKNYAWLVNGSETTADQTATLTITKKALVLSSSPASSSAQWGLGDSGKLVVTAATGTSESVNLNMYYMKDGETTQQTVGVNNATGELDVSKITSAGNYTLYVELANPNLSANAVNKNYEITGGKWSVAFKINAGGVSTNTLVWQVSADGGAAKPLFKTDGSQEKIEYSYDSVLKKAVKYSVTAEIPAGGYLQLDTFCAESGYKGGYRTTNASGAVVTEVTDAGTYKTRIALISDSDHLFDASHAHSTGDLTKGWVEIEWTVEKKEVDFSKADWLYSLDGNETDPTANWTKYDPANGNKPTFNKGMPVYVKLDDKFITDLGLGANDVVISYGGTNEESSPNYNGGNGTPTHTVAQIVLKSTNPNYTLTSSVVSFDWYLYNEQLEALGWTTRPITGTSTDGTQKAFEFPALDLPAGFENYVEYTYTFTINGQTYTDVSEADMKKAVFDYADETHPVSVTVTPHIKAEYASQFDLDLTNTTPTDTKTIGENKLMVNLEFTGSHKEYGDGGDFALKATYYSKNDKTTPALDFLALGGAQTEVKLTLPDGNTVTFTADNLGDVINHLENAGEYKFEFKITDDRLSKKYSFSPSATLTLTIAQKSIALPTIGEIVFTGGSINLVDYMTGFDANLMEFVTGSEYEDIRNVSENGYTAKIRIKDNNYKWSVPEASPAGYAFADNEFNVSETDPALAELKWNVAPLVVDTTNLWNKGSKGASLNLPQSVKDLIAGGSLELGYRYYDSDGNFVESPEIKGGKSFKVEAVFGGDDALRNVQFKTGDTTLGNTSPAINYTVPQSGAAAFFGNALSFFKSNWLWFLI